MSWLHTDWAVLAGSFKPKGSHWHHLLHTSHLPGMLQYSLTMLS